MNTYYFNNILAIAHPNLVSLLFSRGQPVGFNQSTANYTQVELMAFQGST
ncbi:hypothetical protein H6F96_11550 [Microcoleus sp. FACHB-53]|nr:hypothetical protein [Microcoleus sp. FACHB-53]